MQDAALALFAENGYEDTTVSQIAERAGLNRATFFRHFADKREVLFGGEEVLSTVFREAISGASADADLFECIEAALTAADTVMTPAERPRAAERRRIAAANVDVRERGLLKSARVAASITSALSERGMDDLTARLGAEMLILAFANALREWSDAQHPQAFSTYAGSASDDLRARVRALTAAPASE
ncbi:TetR/AcrR family transcriptional regulator [Humibacter soli]